jgi:hypothetical protein
MDPETPIDPVQPASPFAGLEYAFAADQEPIRHDFQMLGQACFLVVRPMDASALARYQSIGQTMTIDTTKRTVETAQVHLNQDLVELELLGSSISDFLLAQKTRARDGSGETGVKLIPASALHPGARKELYKTLTPQFRAVLVQLCLEANGFSPLTS